MDLSKKKKKMAWIYLKNNLLAFSGSLPFNYKNPIKRVSLNNQSCQSRPTLIDINSNENLFHSFIVSAYNCVEVAALLMIRMLEYVFQIK